MIKARILKTFQGKVPVAKQSEPPIATGPIEATHELGEINSFTAFPVRGL